jgi:hypothetical protein
MVPPPGTDVGFVLRYRRNVANENWAIFLDLAGHRAGASKELVRNEANALSGIQHFPNQVSFELG